jgi:lysozyme family protein
MNNNWDASFNNLIKHEGGYVNHPRDPGGATNLGVTQRTLSEWRRRPVTIEEVKNLTRKEAEAIYRANYWEPVGGDALPPGVDIAVFDAAVNSGVRRSSKWLQRAVGMPESEVDGNAGPATLTKLRGLNPRVVALNVCDQRISFLRGLPTWPVFGRGWSTRMADVRAQVLKATY